MLFEKGASAYLTLIVKMMVSVCHKELEHKVKKLKCKK